MYLCVHTQVIKGEREEGILRKVRVKENIYVIITYDTDVHMTSKGGGQSDGEEANKTY